MTTAKVRSGRERRGKPSRRLILCTSGTFLPGRHASARARSTGKGDGKEQHGGQSEEDQRATGSREEPIRLGSRCAARASGRGGWRKRVVVHVPGALQ